MENRLLQRMRANVKIIHKNDSAIFLHLDTHMLCVASRVNVFRRRRCLRARRICINYIAFINNRTSTRTYNTKFVPEFPK